MALRFFIKISHRCGFYVFFPLFLLQSKQRWMRLLKTVCLGISIAALGSLGGCTSSEELMQATNRKNTKCNTEFLDDVTIKGCSTNVHTNISGGKVVLSEDTHRRNKKASILNSYIQQKYSELMNVAPDYIRSLKLYSFIDDWYGVRYRLGGNDKSGIDCSAFVQQLYGNVFNIDLVRTSFDQYNSVTYVWHKTELHEGDLVFFRTRGKHITHVGVYLMNSYFVHASTSGVMISSLKEGYWSQRFAGAGYVDLNKNKG